MHKHLVAITALCLGLATLGTSANADTQLNPPLPAASETSPSNVTVLDPQNPALMAIAKDFAKKISEKFEQANTAMGITPTDKTIPLPEGETLLFNIALSQELVLDGVVSAQVKDNTLLVSMRDFVNALELPIGVDKMGANGWYIRENKKFALNPVTRTVTSDQGTFTMSDKIVAEDDDFLVPINELGTWFDFKMQTELSQLQISLQSDTPLPAEEKFLRGKRDYAQQRLKEPQQPLKKEPPALLEIPFVDVATQTTYRKTGESSLTDLTRNGTISTTGDFAYGTLTTQTFMDDTDAIVDSVHATYKRESLKPELLGALKARQFELGDVHSANQPLTSRSTSGLGFTVTNEERKVGAHDTETDISGYATPGWDVDLYRNNQIISSQTVDNSGRYNFESVRLFSNNNNFKLVMYGPQGEVQEETLSIPIDVNRIANATPSYNVSVMTKDNQTYRSEDFGREEDDSQPMLSAEYETPFGDYSYANIGIEAGELEDHSAAVVHGGFSTTAWESLFNFDAGVDAAGELGSEFVWRRSFGPNDLVNTVLLQTEDFDADPDKDNSRQNVFNNHLEMTGPANFIGLGTNPRYNLDFAYGIDAGGSASTSGEIGLGTNFKRLAFNEQLKYFYEDDFSALSSTTVSGSWGKNRLRFIADMDVMPTPQLRTSRAVLLRNLTDDIDLDFEIARQSQERINEVSAQLNWLTGRALISPSVIYNSNGDMTIALNTRFGLAQDPQTQGIHTFDQPVSLDGGISVYVFLDKNGNGQPDDDEPPVEDAIVTAPQNGGQQYTDKDGYAFFTRLEKLRLTDVYVEPDSLQDPFWVPATKGVSILPREGHVSQLVFAVVQAGEMDGNLLEGTMGAAKPVSNVPITLYKRDGEKILNTISDDGGYYLLSPIPPGDYIMMIGSSESRSSNTVRPTPRLVHIGYEGTIINNYNIYMQAGNDDAPVRIMTSAADMQSDDPGFDPNTVKGNTIVLNLGTYESNLLMSLMWYKTRKLYSDSVLGLQTLVAPSDSYAAAKTGLHTLRVGANTMSLEEGTKRCGVLNAGGIRCTVEIFPGALQVTKL